MTSKHQIFYLQYNSKLKLNSLRKGTVFQSLKWSFRDKAGFVYAQGTTLGDLKAT